MRSKIAMLVLILFGLHANGQQVLGNFSSQDQSEWPVVIWNRDTGNNWDEGLIKNSSTQGNPFGRAGFGIHMHESKGFTFWSTGWNPLFAIQGGTGNAYLKGNVGIGAQNPVVKFQVNSDNNGTGAGNWIAGNLGGTSGDRVVMGVLNGVATIGSHNNALNAWSNLAINPDSYGNVSIGTADAKGHRLAVNGSIIATEVVVKTYGNWPDFVFKPAYKLPALSEVKSYVNRNGHLPDVPSAAKVDKQGVNLGEMNRLLVKKVEELTLYLIEKDKQDKRKDQVLKQLQKQINQLKKIK